MIQIIYIMQNMETQQWHRPVSHPSGRQVTHPEDEYEQENENLKENKRKYREMRRNWGNIPILPTRWWEAGYSGRPNWERQGIQQGGMKICGYKIYAIFNWGSLHK